MTKKVSANQNLKIAHELKRQGFDSMIEAQPELMNYVKAAIDAKTSPKTIHREAIRKFPKLIIPSRASFYNYAKKYIEERDGVRKITVDPGTEEYFKMIGSFDVLKEMYVTAKAMEKEVEAAIVRGARTDTVRKLRSDYGIYLRSIAEVEMRLGLRQKAIEAFKLIKAGGSGATSAEQIIVSEEEVNELVNDLDRLFANRTRLAKWSAAKKLSPEQAIAVGARKE